MATSNLQFTPPAPLTLDKEGQCLTVLTAFEEPNVKPLIGFSLMAKVKGGLVSAAVSWAWDQHRKTRSVVASAQSIDSYNEFLNDEEEDEINAEHAEENGLTPRENTEVNLRKWLWTYQRLAASFPEHADLKSTILYKLNKAVEKVQKRPTTELEELSKMAGIPIHEVMADEERTYKEKVDFQVQIFREARNAIRNHGRIVEILREDEHVTSVEDRECQRLPNGFDELLVQAADSARTGIYKRRGEKSLIEIGADIHLINEAIGTL